MLLHGPDTYILVGFINYILVSTKAQLGFSMPLFLPSFLLLLFFASPTITVGSSLARLIFYDRRGEVSPEMVKI